MRRKIEDLTGQKFGKLTPIEVSGFRYTQCGRRRPEWRCICDCGRERIVLAAYLKRGIVVHCGHCIPPANYRAKAKVCRHCQYSTWHDDEGYWECSQDVETRGIKESCDKFYCAPADKVTGAKHRQDKCYICGAPVYSRNNETPIYCEKHRYQTELDSRIVQEAPMELLFALIEGIFQRAREDYIFNTDGEHDDAEKFFNSQWAQSLSLNGFDADALLDILDEEIMDGLKRADEDIE